MATNFDEALNPGTSVEDYSPKAILERQRNTLGAVADPPGEGQPIEAESDVPEAVEQVATPAESGEGWRFIPSKPRIFGYGSSIRTQFEIVGSDIEKLPRSHDLQAMVRESVADNAAVTEYYKLAKAFEANEATIATVDEDILTTRAELNRLTGEGNIGEAEGIANEIAGLNRQRAELIQVRESLHTHLATARASALNVFRLAAGSYCREYTRKYTSLRDGLFDNLLEAMIPHLRLLDQNHHDTAAAQQLSYWPESALPALPRLPSPAQSSPATPKHVGQLQGPAMTIRSIG